MTSNPNQSTYQPGEYDLVLVDQSKDAELAAQAEADTRLTEELNEGGRIRRFAKSIWKGNIAKDYYRHKYKKEAEQRIVETQDVLIHESTSQEHRDMAMLATIERFQSEYDEMIHDQAGESRHEVGVNSEVATSLKGIIREFAEGRLNETNLLEERARTLQAYRDESGQELAGAGKVQIDNLLDVARAVRGAVEHGESIDAIIDGMKVVSGESRSGVRTEVNASRTDQIFEKLGKSKVGTLIGSEAAIAAATISMSVLRFGSKRAVGAAAMTVAPGIGAGLLAGLREKKRVKDDWAQHSREIAQGKIYDEATAKRRQEMEETRYETVAANDLIAELRVHLQDGALDNDNALQTAIEQLSAITARENYSDVNNVDLISYSAATEVERERFQLALSRAELKVLLRERLGDDDLRQRLGITPGVDIDALIQAGADDFTETVIETDISTKDAAFKKLRNRRVAKAAAAGALVGMTFGVTAQEVGASFSSTREGLIEQLWSHDTELHDGLQHNTLLNGLAGDSEATTTITSHENESSISARETFGDRGVFTGNVEMHQNPDGTLNFTNSEGNVLADKLEIRQNGRLTEESLATLKDKGFHVEDTSFREQVINKETKTVGLSDYLENHRDETTKVTRDLWYDNDTPAPVFDQNELGLHWGGESGSGLTENGNVQFSVATMQAEGSYHADQETFWQQEAQQGNLKLAISPSGNTQDTPFLIDIRPDGTVDIPKDHPAAQFFSNEDGKAVFNGRYAEVVQMTGADENGVEHIRPLATHVGEDSLPPLQDTITTKESIYHPQYNIITSPEVVNTESGSFTEMAPVIPVTRRKSLEALDSRGDNPYYYGYGLSPAEQRRFRREECSPRLNRDPKAQFNPSEELSWRRARIAERQGDEYLAEIDAHIEASTELRELSGDTKAIVTIPVAAASEQDNIYKTLKSYASQDGDLSSKTLLLHLNWFDRPKQGKGITQADQDANVQKTWDEIERARHDFPQLKIATMQSEWSRDKEAAGEYGDGIIGHVARRMYDVAMMTVERRMSSGSMSRDQDVLLIRNDSDAEGIQRTYLESMVSAMEQHPENDIFTGAIRWGTKRHRDLPGLAVVSNFREIMHVLASRKGVDTWPPTVGINTAVRMSTFAAVGSVGDNPQRTGIGTDDYNIGGRVKDARQDAHGGRRKRYGYYGPNPSDRTPQGVKSYGTRGLNAVEDYSYQRHVVGATIDTAPDRLEKAYVNGVAIHNAWGNWDNTTRSEGLGVSPKDDLSSDEGRNKLIERVEKDLSVAISHRFINRKHVASALAFQFKDPRYYKIVRDGLGLKFSLTSAGRKKFINDLTRDSKGRFDPIGARVRRALYNEVAPGSVKQPVPRQPVLV